jgi:hypothetical protein
MTPEELERLECCTSEIAKILYNNTPPSELTSLENIEKHLRQQWLAHVGPQIGCLRQIANISYENAAQEVEVHTGVKIGHTCLHRLV